MTAMARLNEPPAPVESIESLKRRFVRQNRDLARCNSVQAVKIRSLETDLSHQLSENASLRTRILSLEQQLEDAYAFDVRQNLGVLHAKLKTHFDGVLADLAALEKKPRRRKSQIVTSTTSPKRSPQRREWRNTSTLSEVLASQGGTMPTISEGKSYPRRTLEQVEVRQLIDDDDSPDMAPPRTFLDHEQETGEEALEKESAGAQDVSMDQMSAVEIRRRRRDSRIHERSGDDESSNHPIKAGAKRKLSFSEPKLEEKPLASPRRILANKPVNNDPVVSPRKSISALKDTSKPLVTKPIRPTVRETPPVATSRNGSRVSTTTSSTRTRPSDVKTSSKAAEAKPTVRQVSTTATFSKEPTPSVTDPDENLQTVKLEPKTPNPLDLFSPPSTEPSATVPLEGRPGTPPPSSIPATNTSADPNGFSAAAGGRGSMRRNRSAVSYAEPKLNVKMRRPGKELADAVTKNERLSDVGTIKIEDRERSTSLAPEPASTSNEPNGARVIHDPAPGSPLADKKQRAFTTATSSTKSGGSVGTDRTGLDIFEVECTPPAPPPERAPSRLSSRAQAGRAVLDIDKTLPSLPSKAHPTATNTTLRTARRATVAGEAAKNGEKSGDEASAPMREVRLRARRMSSAGALRADPVTIPDAAGDEGRAASAADLRSERIAERRRSMVL